MKLRNSEIEVIYTIVSWLKENVKIEANLCTNSMQVSKGDVFFAFQFEEIDNRRYVSDAIARGAAAIIWQPNNIELNTSERVKILDFCASFGSSIPRLSVLNLSILIGPICSLWYGEPSKEMLMIGVTGTNGKTSTSYWIASALEFLGISCGIIGTLGCGMRGHLLSTGYTTPDAAQLQSELHKLNSLGTQAASMEVSSHALIQRRIVGVDFDIAIFTNCTQDHLDYHKTLKNYRQAKASFFLFPSIQLFILNCHDQLGAQLIREYVSQKMIIGYTIFPASTEIIALSKKYKNFRLLQADQIKFDVTGLRFFIQDNFNNNQRYQIHVPFLGFYNVENLLVVAAVCLFLGLDPVYLCNVLSHLPQIPGRMQLINREHDYTNPKVIVDYAHTPDALKKSLEVLARLKSQGSGRIIVIFGCGGNRDVSKRPIMGRIATALADLVVLTSDNPRYEKPKNILYDIYRGIDEFCKKRVLMMENRAQAIVQTIRREAKAEDIVLIAGKGHEKTQSIEGKEYIFSDEDYAKFALYGE